VLLSTPKGHQDDYTYTILALSVVSGMLTTTVHQYLALTGSINIQKFILLKFWHEVVTIAAIVCTTSESLISSPVGY